MTLATIFAQSANNLPAMDTAGPVIATACRWIGSDGFGFAKITFPTPRPDGAAQLARLHKARQQAARHRHQRQNKQASICEQDAGKIIIEILATPSTT